MSSKNDILQVSYTAGSGTGLPPEKLLLEIGKIASNGQALEAVVTRLLAELVGCDYQVAHICFWGMGSQVKRETVLNLSYLRFPKADPRHESIVRTMGRYRSITTDRSHIIHALWAVEGGAWMRTYLPSSSEKLDNYVGGYPERKPKTASMRDSYNYTIKDMGDVLYHMVSFKIEIDSIIAINLRNDDG